jgi:hypothetical protein
MCSIVVTLLPMPAALLRSPSQWTVEIHGNISITIGLFIVRYVTLTFHGNLLINSGHSGSSASAD